MGWPLWSTLVPRLPDLLRYQHHNCWNTSEWELILHSLHHLCHLHCELRLAVRSTYPLGVCQHWLRLTGIGWGSTFSFPSSFVSCLGSIPDLLPTSRYSPHLHLSLGHFLTSRLLSSLTPHCLYYIWTFSLYTFSLTSEPSHELDLLSYMLHL